MSAEEDNELAALLDVPAPFKPPQGTGYAGMDLTDLDLAPREALQQWATKDGKVFYPTASTERHLIPGLYDIKVDRNGQIYFELVTVSTEDLIRFPHTNSDLIVGEISKFWDRSKTFRQFGLTHKRGILLYGPAGSGKSKTIQLVLEDVIQRGGVAIRWGNAPILITEGLRILRAIQVESPVVILMEDIDSIIEHQSESDVLNILDGVELVSGVVFLASTNYPEKLGARIVNRPSRFDKRFKIGYPTPESRRIYIKHLLKGDDLGFSNPQALENEIDSWVEDTNGFTFAHIRELFIAVVILGDNYHNAIRTLTGMKEKMTSREAGSTGFRPQDELDK